MVSSSSVCGVAALLLALSLTARAQTGVASVSLTGQVSPSVAVSANSGALRAGGDAQVSVASTDIRTVAVSISCSGDDEIEVDIPLQLRSNAEFALDASLTTDDALATSLSIARVEATGKFVFPAALRSIEIKAPFDDISADAPAQAMTHNLSKPVTILRSPPISSAGTFSSHGNALEVVVRLTIRARDAGARWSGVLTISAVPLKTGHYLQ